MLIKNKKLSALIALEDGTIIRGNSFGACRDSFGEVVFNTGMSGYQEIITDPSYAGQIVMMTYPEIGNVGINSADYESASLFLSGFIVHNINKPSSWRSEKSLQDMLIRDGVPALSGIDTRFLTYLIRTKGTLKAFIHCSDDVISDEECVKKAGDWEGLTGQDYASKVTTLKPYDFDTLEMASMGYWETSGLSEGNMPKHEFSIVAYDFGIKWNILRSLRINGIKTTVVPAAMPSDEVLKLKPDGVFFSNGPADPSAVTYAVRAASELIGKVPIMGICLGHQILSIACGGVTSRLKFGHHGCNHPVKNLLTNRVEITSQNHNFAVLPESLKSTDLEVTHINLNDMSVEGVKHRREPLFAVQYHPEASPGPHDSSYLFNQFKEIMSR